MSQAVTAVQPVAFRILVGRPIGKGRLVGAPLR